MKLQTWASFLLHVATPMCDTPLDLSLQDLSFDMHHAIVCMTTKNVFFPIYMNITHILQQTVIETKYQFNAMCLPDITATISID